MTADRETSPPATIRSLESPAQTIKSLYREETPQLAEQDDPS